MASLNVISALRCRNDNFRKYSYRITIVTLFTVRNGEEGRKPRRNTRRRKPETLTNLNGKPFHILYKLFNNRTVLIDEPYSFNFTAAPVA